ncbi:sirohydrochlorin chelatase [Nocardia stercoris]|uniref:Sirohydrochlorin chelatase n=1 Tax=Nocardia stercoris TaxID=2483361 RepID=A0A3M2LLT4_9NOCA|nr:sirohydrochlorin chelatase [Nocardia stercoris]RMI35778.1 sirohydrochlorin chelatase [Nocardia stercoris]
MHGAAPVLVAHGTRSVRGVEMIGELAVALAAELGVERVPTAFVDVLGPAPSDLLRELNNVPAVLIPAFLASGYHVYQDVPREIADSGHDAVAVTPALGPDPVLARVMRSRLRDAGWRPGDAVVFAAAGSSDARARHDVRRAAAMLGDLLDTPAPVAYIATGTPRVADVIAEHRNSSTGRVFIASYLLAHGLFHQRLHESGADGVAEPIGAHPAVVRLLASRYHTAARELVSAAA